MPDTNNEKPVVTSENTVAILSDPASSDFLLAQTLDSFARDHETAHVIIDISTKAGLAAALHFHASALTYSIFDTVVPDNLSDRTKARQSRVIKNALSTEVFDRGAITEIQAGIMVIPAALATDDPRLNLSIGTITGAAVDQIQKTQQQLWVLMPPESGLRGLKNGSYVRTTLAVQH